MHRRFCRLSDPQTSVNLVVFNYFHLRGDYSALKMLFDEETRENFAKTIEKMDVPTVLRLTVHRRKEKMKDENRRFRAISKCQLCTKHIVGFPMNLREHIGLHEEIPSYCFMEGCNKYLTRFNGLTAHLLKKHQMYQNDFSPEQYHLLESMRVAYHKKAALFMDKYFPAESLVGFSDNRTRDVHELEDEKCSKCGEIVKAATSRRQHASIHMNLFYDCVIAGCPTKTNSLTFAKHLKNRHSKKIGQLNVVELQKHRQNKAHFSKVMKEELSKYFPRKSGAVQEVEE